MRARDDFPDSLSLRQAAEQFGISIQTLRSWEAQGKIVGRRGPRGLRRYPTAQILQLAHSQDERVRQAQQVVVDVARSIASSLEIESVAQTVVDAAVRVVGSDRCAIYLVSPDRRTLHPLWAIDVKEPGTAQNIFFTHPIPVDAIPLLSYALEHPEPVVVDDTETHPLSNPEVFRYFDTRTVINVGLRGADGQVFALMPFLWTGAPHAVREDDVFFARSLAALAEVALANARLFSQIEQERARAMVINAVVQDVTSGRDLDETLRRAISSMVAQLGADDGSIWLADASGTSVVGAMELRQSGASRLGVRLRLAGSSQLDRAIEYGRPLLIGLDETTGSDREWFEALGLTAALYVPLLSEGRLIGIALINYLKSRPVLAEADLAFADVLAGQCGLAIERARLLDAAATRAAELEAVLSQMDDGIVIVDRQGLVAMVNAFAARLFGTDSIGLPSDGRPPSYYLIGRDAQVLAPEDFVLWRAALMGEIVSQQEFTIRRSDGSAVVVNASATPIVGAHGEKLGAVLVLRDVTARRQLEAEKDQFLSVVSHELKTPLTSIKGLNELAKRRLHRGLSGMDIIPHLDGLGGQVRRMEALIADLLDIQRLETGVLPLRRAQLDFGPIVTEACERARWLTERHTIVCPRVDEPLPVLVDQARIEQVLDNLLSNAIKYSPSGGTIVLAVSRDAAAVEVTVEDPGIGIPETGRERLFQRFYRGANVHGSEYNGLGIGLALSRDIVLRHGGTLMLQSSSPAGSIFCLRLPLALGLAPADAAPRD